MKIGPTPMPLTPSPERQAQDLRKAAEGFEAIFLSTFLKAARQTTLGDDLMGGSAVDRTRDMFDAEVTRLASGRSGFGIADAVERQFKPLLDVKG
jgi:flagellar protein FlgJ